MPDRPPNILVIMDDQHHAGCLGCDDRPQVKTPNLERLARNGVLFRRSYTTAVCCVPSRTSFMTGMYPHAHGVYNGGKTEIPAHYLSLPAYLREQLGYRTAITGKRHFGKWRTSTFDFDTGDDCSGYAQYLREIGLHDLDRQEFGAHVLDYLAYQTRIPYEHSEPVWLASQTIQWIDQGAAEARPFFVWANFDMPHPATRTPPDCPLQYDPARIDLGQIPTSGSEHRRRMLLDEGSRRFGCEHAWNIEVSGEAKYRQALAHYYGMISMVDDNVGRMISFLQDKGLLENTIVVFTSDHGDFAGEYGQMGKNAQGHFECIQRVPLIWYWQGHFGTDRIFSFVENIDIFPTLCDLLGLDIPHQVQGESYADVLRYSASGPGPAPETKEAVFFDSPFTKTIRTRQWWLSYTFDGTSRGELYDLGDDPLMMQNRFDAPALAPVRERLLQQLLAWSICTDQPVGWAPSDKANPPSHYYRTHPRFGRRVEMNRARLTPEQR